MIRTTLGAWGFSLVALLAACAGLSAVSASSADASPVSLGVAAAALSLFAALVGLTITPRAERTRLRCVVWGGAVPVLVGVVTTLLAAAAGGAGVGLVSGLPWLTGVVAALVLGPVLPAVRLRLPRRNP